MSMFMFNIQEVSVELADSPVRQDECTCRAFLLLQ